jgi:hypothetical protein
MVGLRAIKGRVVPATTVTVREVTKALTQAGASKAAKARCARTNSIMLRSLSWWWGEQHTAWVLCKHRGRWVVGEFELH